MRALAWVTAVGLIACSPSTESPVSEPDASSVQPDAGAEPPDGGADLLDGAAPPADTAKTSLEVEVNGVTRTLTRAQFGTDGAGAEQQLHVEAYQGGDPACPDEDAPTPNRTVVLAGVPGVAEPGDVFTEADDVAFALLDHTGDQLPAKPIASATAVKVTVVKIDVPTSVELEVEATLEGGGRAAGRLFATYCESMTR